MIPQGLENNFLRLFQDQETLGIIALKYSPLLALYLGESKSDQGLAALSLYLE